MSSFLERNRLAFAIQAGATDFIPKPLEMPQLVEKVWAFLSSRGFVRVVAGEAR
jgi:DNA-binding response OmpR family regulator